MAHGHRRHVKGSAIAFGGVVAWCAVGLSAGCGLLVGFGVDWTKAVLGSGGLLLVLLAAYALERAGLMRPPDLDPSRRADQRPSAASGGPPREPPVP